MSHPRLTFHGAARAVTGSCFRLETARGQVLIDCGMFQGAKTEKELNYRPLPFDPQKIDAADKSSTTGDCVKARRRDAP